MKIANNEDVTWWLIHLFCKKATTQANARGAFRLTVASAERAKVTEKSLAAPGFAATNHQSQQFSNRKSRGPAILIFHCECKRRRSLSENHFSFSTMLSASSSQTFRYEMFSRDWSKLFIIHFIAFQMSLIKNAKLTLKILISQEINLSLKALSPGFFHFYLIGFSCDVIHETANSISIYVEKEKLEVELSAQKYSFLKLLSLAALLQIKKSWEMKLARESWEQ